MRLLTLCSGIGAPELAATWMGWTCALTCEVDPFCNRVLAHHYPGAYHHGDIKTLTGKIVDYELSKRFGIRWREDTVLVAGFPCFVAGTPVLTKKGFVPIEEVDIGDEVLTADRKYHPVEATMNHDANEIVYLRTQGMFEELKCTPNHKFYVRRKFKSGHDGAEYLPVSELKKGDWAGFPVFEGTDHSFSTAFWKLIGRWIADGWCVNAKRKNRANSYSHQVIICCGKKNLPQLHHIIQKAGYNYTMSEEKSVYRCVITDACLCNFLQDFGKYAYGKHLSPQCFQLDNTRKKALLEGWFADGYTDKNGAVKITTVSRQLALGMAQIARDVFKVPVSISKKHVNRTCVIEGREVNERPQYCVTIPKESRYGEYKDGFVWCNIKKIRFEKENNVVYNLSVNEEHSYNVYGIAVHNCQPFSLAGKRLGAEDDRHLWPEVLRLVGEIRPRWFIGENVAGILSMVLPGHEVKVGSHEDIAGESYEEVEVREQSVVERVCSDLESIGYSVVPVVIPACAVGAPHRRDRVWFLASDSNRTGLQTERTEQPPTGTARGGQQRTSSHTERRRGDEMDDQIQSGQPNGTGIDGNGRERTSPHPDDQRRSKLDAPPVASQTEKRPPFRDIEIPNWENFPATQPAIRSGDDGVSGRLLGITFPKWRSESIKALGNSMVPPLLYEIFRIIQEIENEAHR